MLSLSKLVQSPQLTFTRSNLTIETLEQGVKDVKVNARRCYGVFVVGFEYLSHLVLVFLLLTLNM